MHPFLLPLIAIAVWSWSVQRMLSCYFAALRFENSYVQLLVSLLFVAIWLRNFSSLTAECDCTKRERGRASECGGNFFIGMRCDAIWFEWQWKKKVTGSQVLNNYLQSSAKEVIIQTRYTRFEFVVNVKWYRTVAETMRNNQWKRATFVVLWNNKKFASLQLTEHQNFVAFA